MKLRSKETYWLLKDGLINTYPSLQHDTTCDVLIIGAGITGALIAYQLASEGYHVCIIDERDIGMGSTGATTAMLQYEIDEPLYSLSRKTNVDIATSSYIEGVRAIHLLEKIIADIAVDCGFRTKDSLYFAGSKSHLKWLIKEHEARSSCGIQASWQTSDDLKKKYNINSPGGILSKDGADVDAYKLTHALLEHSAKKFDLQIYDHTSFKKIIHNKKRRIVCTDLNYEIRCDNIVFATGYETTQILKGRYVKLNSTYALVSEPMTDLPQKNDDTIFWNTNEPYLYLRSTPDRRIVLGGGDEPFKDADQRDKLIDEKEKFLIKEARKYFPTLKIIPDFVWAGTFGVTNDSLPYIGAHRDFPGCYFVLGYGGNGITFSVMGMKIISDALSGNPNKYLDYFRFNR
ncbi:MAG TPA: FAD-binding oxidoreductase [Cyclobacteriaceae bacterium]